MQKENGDIVVALAGQPNVGKSTVFNLLTGMNQHVGNWPGKTIEQKTGTFTYNGTRFKLVDLPGTYSLSANSPEEVIARNFIIQERPDVVVALLDAAILERSLYLVAELLPLPAPVIVALNMMDVAEQEGMHIEPHVLEAALGVPVIPMIATKNQGTRELVQAIDDIVHGRIEYQPRVPEIRADHLEVLSKIEALIGPCVPPAYPSRWVALKLLEGDSDITEMMRACTPDDVWEQVQTILRAHEDAIIDVAGGRYDWIRRMVRAAVTRPKAGQITRTDKLDRWATHPLWGILILAGILGVVFWLTYTVGAPLQEMLDVYVIGTAADWASTLLVNAPAWVQGLIVDGLIGGVGMVVTFLPILVIFFATMGLLEDIGYMARAAYVMDRFMHLMGLHGKSFLPLFLGFGCNVPAIMGSRVVESRRARLLTIMLAPLVPCTARMVVVTFLTPIFFGSAATLVSWGLVGLSLVVLAIIGILINTFLLRGERAAFIMELPLYHIPNWRTIGLLVWQHSLAFLKKAGTLILVMAVIVWALSYWPGGDVETSFLARFGRLLEPIGALMGMSWRMLVALLASFVAKENSLATLGVLYGTSGETSGLAEAVRMAFTPATALAFLVVQMLFVPCVATVAAMWQETRSVRWTLFNLVLLLVVSFSAGIVVYQVIG
ncbi:MAG: ferrous iron transport protein B [Anaerolineae bacterium]|nr:ferrous iron transport protein B [Anaerolineae bacterium]